jgi:nucleotide-binding universal stress UspA family protein
MHILTALDQSDRDRIILPYCSRLAREMKAELTLVHIVSLPKSLIPHTVREAEAYLDAVAAGLQEEGVAAKCITRRGDPAAEIPALADELDADFIIMATRGRRGLDKAVLGSVTEAVLAHSPRPVLLVNELTNRTQLDEKQRLQSYYLAGVIWNKQASGEYTEVRAVAELERLAAAGLDRAVLFSTYRSLAREGAPSEWLDIDFQMETLKAFLPGEVQQVSGGDQAVA